MNNQNLQKGHRTVSDLPKDQISISITGGLFDTGLNRRIESGDYRLALLNLTLREFFNKLNELGLTDKSQACDIEFIVQDYLERDYSIPVTEYIDEYDFEELDFI